DAAAEDEEFYFDDEEEQDEQESSAANQGEKAFMDLFNLPKGLSSPLPFAEVIAKARNDKRWLIYLRASVGGPGSGLDDISFCGAHSGLSIYEGSPDGVHRMDATSKPKSGLDVDIWKQSMVQDLLKTGFILWQRSKEEPEAVQYLNYYCKDDQASLPLIHVLDPRTGRKCEQWDVGKFSKDPVEALQKMTDFTDRYDFDKPPPSRRHHRHSGASSSQPSSSSPSSPPSSDAPLDGVFSAASAVEVPPMPSLPAEGDKD
ncbi:UBX domain-containing protein 7, partial [Perkinsus olseni]